MRDRNGFSLAKKRVGAYFNDGESIMWCQRHKEFADVPEPRIVAAVRAAKRAFNRVYNAAERIKK